MLIRVFSSTQGFAMEQELHWRPVDVVFSREMVLHTLQHGTASAGNRLGDHGPSAPHC